MNSWAIGYGRWDNPRVLMGFVLFPLEKKEKPNGGVTEDRYL